MAKEKLPVWFRKKIPASRVKNEVEDLIGDLNLQTICTSALCPNRGNCFSNRTATFLIMGEICTRNCTFCAVKKGRPFPPEESEPARLAEAAKRMDLKYVVVTSVTRDDLPDGGAVHFAAVVRELKRMAGITVEILIPDFQGSLEALRKVIRAEPDVINHNLETVSRLYPEVRPQADFHRSLELLKKSKELARGIVTKSGFMVGLGETPEELFRAMEELRQSGCDLLTIGQYLQPSLQHHPVVRYVPPQEFEEYARRGEALGFRGVASAPLVRSSFEAAELFQKIRSQKGEGAFLLTDS
ncbi:MAG: lipoyl synthase [Thermodesulfobacteriota bacterium]